MERAMRRAPRFCVTAVLAAVLCFFAGLAAAGLFVTARLGATAEAGEMITFVREETLRCAGLCALLLSAIAGMHRLLEHFAHLRLTAGLCALWLAGTLVFLLGANVRQMYDFAYVSEAAQLFAQGNYKPMEIDYFNVYSYQLGICFPMEVLLRFFPGLNLNLFMQGLNAVLSIATAGVLAALAQMIFDGRPVRRAVILLSVLFLPMMLYSIYVYGTLPMLFLTACAMLCFVRYLRARSAKDALAYALLIALAYMLKPNAAVPLIAMGIAAALDVMTSRDWKLLGFAALSIALAAALSWGVIAQYELRSGVKLTGDVSMLARLVMGLQDGGPAAGWFNRYTERFFGFDVTAEQERAIASADLAARLAQMRADPRMAASFFCDKLLSQWLEPTYSTMWYGNLCEKTGTLAKAVFAQDGFARALLEGYMKISQQALYLLAAVGMAGMMRERRDAAQLILPLTILGGFLYHMIFEAKSQYIYVYAMMMIPLAARGLCAARDGAENMRRRLARRRAG